VVFLLLYGRLNSFFFSNPFTDEGRTIFLTIPSIVATARQNEERSQRRWSSIFDSQWFDPSWFRIHESERELTTILLYGLSKASHIKEMMQLLFSASVLVATSHLVHPVTGFVPIVPNVVVSGKAKHTHCLAVQPSDNDKAIGGDDDDDDNKTNAFSRRRDYDWIQSLQQSLQQWPLSRTSWVTSKNEDEEAASWSSTVAPLNLLENDWIGDPSLLEDSFDKLQDNYLLLNLVSVCSSYVKSWCGSARVSGFSLLSRVVQWQGKLM